MNRFPLVLGLLTCCVSLPAWNLAESLEQEAAQHEVMMAKYYVRQDTSIAKDNPKPTNAFFALASLVK